MGHLPPYCVVIVGLVAVKVLFVFVVTVAVTIMVLPGVVPVGTDKVAGLFPIDVVTVMLLAAELTDQETKLAGIIWLLLSCIVRLVVDPAGTVVLPTVIVIEELTKASTRICTVLLVLPPLTAVMVAFPAATGAATPELLTVTMEVLELVHVVPGSLVTTVLVPSTLKAVAENCTVSARLVVLRTAVVGRT